MHKIDFYSNGSIMYNMDCIPYGTNNISARYDFFFKS